MNTLAHKDYQGRFEYDQDTGYFHGGVSNITGVITFQGRSTGELKKLW